MIAEAWFVAPVGSRLALTRPHLRRLSALSRHSPRTEEPRGPRRSGLGIRRWPVIAQDRIEGCEQLAHDGDGGEARCFTGFGEPNVEASQRRIVAYGNRQDM